MDGNVLCVYIIFPLPPFAPACVWRKPPSRTSFNKFNALFHWRCYVTGGQILSKNCWGGGRGPKCELRLLRRKLIFIHKNKWSVALLKEKKYDGGRYTFSTTHNTTIIFKVWKKKTKREKCGWMLYLVPNIGTCTGARLKKITPRRR